MKQTIIGGGFCAGVLALCIMMAARGPDQCPPIQEWRGIPEITMQSGKSILRMQKSGAISLDGREIATDDLIPMLRMMGRSAVQSVLIFRPDADVECAEKQRVRWLMGHFLGCYRWVMCGEGEQWDGFTTSAPNI